MPDSLTVWGTVSVRRYCSVGNNSKNLCDLKKEFDFSFFFFFLKEHQCLYQFIFPPTVKKDSILSTPSLAFIIYRFFHSYIMFTLCWLGGLLQALLTLGHRLMEKSLNAVLLVAEWEKGANCVLVLKAVTPTWHVISAHICFAKEVTWPPRIPKRQESTIFTVFLCSEVES